MLGLERKLVVITGGAGAIGQAICLRLLQAGANIAIIDLNHDNISDALNRFKELGYQALVKAYEADITDLAALTNVASRVRQDYGSAEILINNAGWEEYRRFIDTDQAYREKSIAINLMGTFNVLESFLPDLIENNGGRIVNIASEAGRIGSPGEAIYSACKAGLIGLSKTLAREHAKHGITVNAVCPGPIETPLLQKFISGSRSPERFRAGLEANIPLGRIGKPEDIAGLVAFLASPESSYITGEIVSVSGGLSMAG